MKNTAYHCFALALLASLAVLGCGKDAVESLSEGQVIPEYEYVRILKANTRDVSLNIATSEAQALSLQWESYDYTKSMAVEMSGSDSFSDIQSVTAVSNRKDFTHSMLNQVMMSLGAAPDVRSPLYIRVRYQRTNNLGYRFSDTLRVDVTPYSPPQQMEVLDVEMSSFATLHSPYGNGLFTGYVPASSGMEVWLRSDDETLYGSGQTAFSLTSDNPSGPLRLPAEEGCYRLRGDVTGETVSMALIKKVTLLANDGSEHEMKYSKSANVWTADVEVNFNEDSEGQKQYLVFASARMDVALYDAGSGYDSPVQSEEQLSLAPQTVSGSGSFTFRLDMSGETPEFGTGSGGESGEGAWLLMVNTNDVSDVKNRLYSAGSDGIYKGLYYASGWENFLFRVPDGSQTYGCGPSNDQLYKLVPESDEHWNPWIDSDTEAFRLFTVDMNEMTWSSEVISSVVAVGEGLTWDLAFGAKMSYDKESKAWRATMTLDGDETLQIVLNNDWKMRLMKRRSSESLALVADEASADNIPVPAESGEYDLIINTFDMGNITYAFEKR